MFFERMFLELIFLNLLHPFNFFFLSYVLLRNVIHNSRIFVKLYTFVLISS